MTSPSWAAEHPDLIGLAVLTADNERAIAAKPASEFKECATGCPMMVVLPPGKFMMGSPENGSDLDAGEHPQREVTIAKSFAASKCEVTVENWDACVAATACRQVPDSWGRGRMPVINVSWRDAKQYVGWLARVDRQGLPAVVRSGMGVRRARRRQGPLFLG